VPKAKRVAAKFPVREVEVVVLESLSPEGERYGILFTPTVMVNNKVIAAGRGVSEKDIEKYVKKALEDK
jgi:hypothetical protein